MTLRREADDVGEDYRLRTRYGGVSGTVGGTSASGGGGGAGAGGRRTTPVNDSANLRCASSTLLVRGALPTVCEETEPPASDGFAPPREESRESLVLMTELTDACLAATATVTAAAEAAAAVSAVTAAAAAVAAADTAADAAGGGWHRLLLRRGMKVPLLLRLNGALNELLPRL